MIRWAICDLATGRQLVDVQVLSGSWSRPLNTPETISCTVDLRDPDTIALRPRNTAAVGRSVLAVIQDDVVLAAGPIWAHSYNRDDKTLQLNAKGIWSYYDHRYIIPLLAATVPVDQFTIPDPAAAGKTKPNPAVGTYLAGWQLGTIAKKLVQQAHTWTGGSVPVVFEADRSATADDDHTRNFEGAEFKNLGQVLQQLTQVLGGPDIRFKPRLTVDRLGIEWVLETGTEAAPLLASTTRHSWNVTAEQSPVSGFSIDQDGSDLTGTAWVTGGRSSDSVLVGRAIDPTLVGKGYPLFEDLDSSHSDASVQATIDRYAGENALMGRTPTETWSFNVEANQQPTLGQYWEGDYCTLDIASYDPATGFGDPYVYEGATFTRRIIGIGGDHLSNTVKIQCAPTNGEV